LRKAPYHSAVFLA